MFENITFIRRTNAEQISSVVRTPILSNLLQPGKLNNLAIRLFPFTYNSMFLSGEPHPLQRSPPLFLV